LIPWIFGLFECIMKNQIILLAIFFLIAACDKDVKHPSITIADKLMESNSDSALTILNQASDSVAGWDKADRMNYALLKTEAEDKCYVTHISDSLIFTVSQYFSHNGTDHQRIRAYYELGRVSSDMQLTGQAIDSYEKALDMEIPDDSMVLAIKARAANWIGQTLMYQNMFQRAIVYFKKARELGKQCNNTSIEIYTLRDLGRAYSSKGEDSLAIMFYNQAGTKSLDCNNIKLYNLIMSELGSLYIDKKRYDKTGIIIASTYNTSKMKENTASDNLYIARYYQGIGKEDSSIVYYQRSLNSGNLYIDISANKELASLECKRGDLKKGIELLHNCLRDKDSLQSVSTTQNENLIKILNQKIEREKKYEQKQKKSLYVNFGLVLFIFISGISTFSYVRKKAINNKNRQEKLKSLLDEQKQRSHETILQNQSQIEKLEMLISQLSIHDSEQELTRLVAQKSTLQSINSKIETEYNLRESRIRELKISTIYISFHSTQFTPNDEDYFSLEETLDKTYDNCMKKIKSLYPQIKEKELRICMLIKIELPLKYLSAYLGYSPSSLTMARERLFYKINKKEGAAKDLDEFIFNL
jgi:tetratricopeptide (TPR) repeat protein